MKQSAKDLAEISDSLCREHGLSVIQNPQDKTVTYDKWQGNQRKFTHRDELRMIIDAALRMQPDGFDALMQLLEDAGCRIKRGVHISIKPPEGKRYIRLDTLGSEYDETSLRRTLAHDHVHIPKIPRGDFTESQVKRLIDIEAKLRASKGKGFQVWAERNNIDAKAQMVIFLKEHQIDSLEELNDQIQGLTDHQNELKASIREKQNRMKEIIRQRQAIRDYSRTKEVYTQYRESGWTVKFYQEHRQEIENHRNAQAVYSSHDGKMPTLKELTAEYDGLKEQKENDQAALDKLKTTPVSLHCWQGDDVRGFDTDPTKPLTGGIQTTGNYPGKATTPEQLMADFPDMRFILIGDDGQKDPTTYATIARRYPGRVLAIGIRQLSPREATGLSSMMGMTSTQPMPVTDVPGFTGTTGSNIMKTMLPYLKQKLGRTDLAE